MNMARIVASMIFPLITFPYTSRILGPEGTGKTSFAFSLVGYFVLLAAIGIPLYGIREVAKIRDDKKAMSALIQELFLMHGVASVVSLVAYIGMIFFIHKLHAEYLLFLIVSTSIPLSALAMDWLYQGMEEYVYITVRSIAFSALSVGALFLFVHHEKDYVAAAAIIIIATLGSSVLNFWNARAIVFAKRDLPWKFQRHIKPLITVYALNFIVSIYINLDTVMLGFLSTATNVGYYSSAMKLTRMLIGMVVSFGDVLLPRLSYYLANEMRDEFDRMLKKSLGVILLLCLPITTALMMISREILLVLAGSKYLPAAGCLVITAPIILFIGLTNIFAIQILYPLGRERSLVLSVSLGAAVAVGLNLILIPRYAHFGAAWGTLIAESVVLIAQFILVRRHYQIHWPWRSLAKYLCATAVMVAFLIGVRWGVPESRMWIRLIIDVPVGAGLYFTLLFLMQEELVREVFAKIKASIFLRLEAAN
jgi:O-antigen/teichoic acid export membrane protein